MDENPIKTRQQLEAQLIERALQDDAFRQELVRDPKGIFAGELGLSMPEQIQVQVLEETPTTVYLVLPRSVASAGAELSDAELESVAGGAWTSDTCAGGHTCDWGTCQATCTADSRDPTGYCGE